MNGKGKSFRKITKETHFFIHLMLSILVGPKLVLLKV